MTVPTISELPDAPSRLDEPSVFVTKADAFVAALDAFVAEANALGIYLDGLSTGTLNGNLAAIALLVSAADTLPYFDGSEDAALATFTAKARELLACATAGDMRTVLGVTTGSAASTTEQLTGTDSSKFATADSIAALWEQGADVASASTVSLGEGGHFKITGTTTITDIDFATDKAGRAASVYFTGALTLTHNASTLILPTGANITTAAGDVAVFKSEGSDVVRCISYTRASGAALVASTYSGGKQSIPILAASMTARTTNGAAPGLTESATNKIMVASLDFDQSTAEYAQFMFPMPKSWNEGTITAQFIWKCGVTGNVIWGIQGVAISDDDVLDATFGTAQTVTDAVTATTDVMISAETSAVTIGGSPAEGDLVVFQVYRDAANGSDTAAGDALLIGIRLFITTNAADDS